jgi:hypothetical protein
MYIYKIIKHLRTITVEKLTVAKIRLCCKKVFVKVFLRPFVIVSYILTLRKFIDNEVRHNTVLLVEARDSSHGEVIPGYAKYLLDLGYNIDLLITNGQERLNPMYRFRDERIKSVNIPFELLYYALSEKKLKNYRHIFFTSNDVPLMFRGMVPIVDFFPQLKQIADKFITVEHHYELVNENNRRIGQIVTPANFGVKEIAVYPSYFGIVNRHNKNQITQFIVVGRKDNKVRNHHILLNAVETLLSKGIDSFKVVVIGPGHLNIPKHIKHLFDQHGQITYPPMFNTLEQADFFLSLLDPDNPKHDRYITIGTSGSYMLVCGFCKPQLIAQKFIGMIGFTDADSLIYENNNQLAETMSKAIKMSQEKYQILQQNLYSLSNKIYQTSLNNLEQILSQ